MSAEISTTPGRLLNDLLQGDWQALHDETKRLFYNTIFGLGGIFDVATTSNIPKKDNNFGQTFKKWGWQPGIFLMLPSLFGPSDVRDGSGLIGDYLDNPLNYFYPFYYVGSGVAANNFSDTVDGAVRFSESEGDSYSILQYAVDLQPHKPQAGHEPARQPGPGIAGNTAFVLFLLPGS